MWPQKFLPVFAPEDGSGVAEGADTNDPGNQAWAPPEGVSIPEDMLGTNADETIGKLVEGYNTLNGRVDGMRTQLAQKPSAPKTPDEYAFEFADTAKPYLDKFDDNPMAPITRQAAHKYGLSQEQVNGFIGEVFSNAGENGLLLAPLDAAKEVNSYKSLAKLDDEAVTQDFAANESFAKGLLGQLKSMPADETIRMEAEAIMMSMTDTAAGNFLLKALSGRLAESGFTTTGEGEDEQGNFTREQLKELANDPRVDPKSPKYDKTLRAKFDAAYAKLGANQ